MKKKLISLVVVSVMLVGLLGGCEITPKKLQYRTLATVGMAVDKAANSVVSARALGKVSEADWQVAKVYHGDFLIGYATACDLASQDLSKLATDDLLRLETRVLTVFNQILQNHVTH